MSNLSDADPVGIDGDQFQVLINDQGQFSLWPAAWRPPEGWSSVGFSGAKQSCIAYVDRNWSDMRPKSPRERMPVASHE